MLKLITTKTSLSNRTKGSKFCGFESDSGGGVVAETWYRLLLAVSLICIRTADYQLQSLEYICIYMFLFLFLFFFLHISFIKLLYQLWNNMFFFLYLVSQTPSSLLRGCSRWRSCLGKEDVNSKVHQPRCLKTWFVEIIIAIISYNRNIIENILYIVEV